MKSKIVLFCLLVAAQAWAQPTVFTLADCLRVALSDNPTIKVADLEVERMDYTKKETLAQLLPQASFTGTYNRMLAKQVMYMNMSNFGGSSSTDKDEETEESTQTSSTQSSSAGKGIKVGLDNSYQVGFSASMPLIAPQLWASLKLSDSQILQSVEQARSSRINLINQVKNAYYALMLAEDSRKVIQESYDMAALTHDIYSKKYEVGAASDYEVLRTSVAMKNIEPELLQADIAIKQAKLQLLILMGLDTTVDFTVEGQLNQYEENMYEKTLNLSHDYSNNSSLILNEITQQQLDQAIKVQTSSFWPTLSANANYMWTNMSNGSPFKNFNWNPYSSVGLSLSLPLFTGGSRYAGLKKAKIQAMENQWQRENLERTVSMQVDLAIDNIQKNVEQIASSSSSVGEAERAYNIMEQSFAIGAASYLDLRDAELALTQSRLAYNQAIYNYLVAQSDLELLLGNAQLDY